MSINAVSMVAQLTPVSQMRPLFIMENGHMKNASNGWR